MTASSQITVLFNADAPTTQDLTGVAFLSTVDDSGTGDAAQSTTMGNGDGNAGDLNSWTVTTTDAAGALVGHWPFDEGTGQIAGDVSGNLNDGTLGPTSAVESGDPAWCVPGGNALDFDGTNDEVKLSFVTIGNSAAWSVTAWIKMGADTADKRTIYSEGNTAQTEYFYLSVAQGGSNVTFYSQDFGASNFAQLDGTTNVEDDAWHLVTVVQRSKTDRELYVGTNSEDTSIQNAGTLSFNTASIGYLRTDWVADPFKGLIDDVRIYDYALSTAEIATLNASPPVACGSTPAVTSAVAEISPNDVITSSTANAFSYDIQATIGGGDTGVNRVAITVPGTFTVAASPVTDVLVGGSSVAFIDNTSGNAISVDLTTKVTASSQITVLFNADAPTTQDLTGVAFLSSVDDSGTGDAAQSTTEGNGDGNAGDANIWTVTTTDAAGGFSCRVGGSIFSDGFETGDLSAWDGSNATTGDSITVSTDQAKSGIYSAKGQVDTVTDAQAMIWKNINGETTIHAKVEIFVPASFSTTGHVTVLHLITAGWQNIIGISINNDMTLYMWNTPAGEAYGYQATSTLSKNAWHTLEIMVTISATVGEARLWLDGNLEITATGKNLGTNPVDRVATTFYWATPGTEANTVYADDVVICGGTPTNFDISGTIFEDVNYGGGVGRDLATANADSGAFTIERDGVTVELYDAAGNYISNTTTAGGGLYSFTGLTPANYTVRVVNTTVTS
ncbi:MAG: hypothetical protein IIA27_17035, partial [Gemmatimonadetes bacterium]|nr:hypothetical protein [Gemmatimonadota bacterium]